MAALSPDDVRSRLSDLPGWDGDEGGIAKRFELADFRAAVAFVVRIAFEAEAADHHPDLDIRYDKVRVALVTHSAGGITDKDLDMARRVELEAPS